MNELELMGRITASLMHDMQNVFSTIRESTGLMQDLLAMDKGSGKYHERIKAMAGAVQEQVDRGARMADALNRFGHMPEHKPGDVDTNAIARLIVFLSERFAKNRRVDLVVEGHDSRVLADVDPATLGLALFQAIDCCLACLPEGCSVRIRVEERDGRGAVAFLCDGQDGVCPDIAALLRDRGCACGISLESADEGGVPGVRLSFPGLGEKRRG